MFNKLLAWYTKLFAFWVLLGGLLAYVCPAPFVALKGGMSWFFALTMFGIGAALTLDDFKAIARNPLIVLLGSAAQFTLMPLGAFLLAWAFRLPPVIALGLILTGSAPGAMASNVMSYIARADTAYSVSLTTVSTLLCPVLTPALTSLLVVRSGLLADLDFQVKFWPMFQTALLTVVVPVIVGLLTRHAFRRSMDKITRIFPAISVTFIIFICSLVIALNRRLIPQLSGIVLLAAIVLNLYGMLSGYGVGTLFHMSNRRRRTLAIEIGMQNAGLGTVLALKHFSEETALPAAAFVFICIITASLLVEIWHYRSSPPAQEDTP